MIDNVGDFFSDFLLF